MGRGGGGRLELLKEEVRCGEGEVRPQVWSGRVVNEFASLLLPLNCFVSILYSCPRDLSHLRLLTISISY